jgi:hypothetical protein
MTGSPVRSALRLAAWVGAVALGPGGAVVAWAQLPPAGAAAPVASATPVAPSRALAAALDALRAEGLPIVYSNALVTPALRVTAEPGDGSAEQRAARLLAPHGLALERLGSGTWVVVRAAPGAPAPASAVAAAAPPPAEPLEQVSVFASRYRVDPAGGLALVDLTRAEIEALPGLDEDVLRVMRYLPGTATNGVSARANVRGGRDNELAVYFDGVPLFEPFHFKDYQGLLGVLDPGSIARLDFYSGVFPVRYGDRLSGVLDLAPRRPEALEDHHEIGLSLLYAHALSVGEREWRDRPLEWLVSLRQSTAELAIRAAGRDRIDPDFLDGLGRVQLRVGETARLSAGFLKLDDTLQAEVSDGRENTESRYRDGTGWLGWDDVIGGDVTLSARLSTTERHTDRRGNLARPGSVVGSVDDDRELSATTLRVQAVSARGWTLGIEAQDFEATYDYAADARFEPLLAAAFGRDAAFSRRSVFDAGGNAGAVFGSILLEPAPRWRLDVGLRVDAQRHAIDGAAGAAPGGRFNDVQWSPRLALEHQWDEDTVLRASAGRVSQTERPDELQVLDGEPRFNMAQRATQVVLGLERRLSPRASLRIEGYHKDVASPAPRFENLLDPVVVLPELEVDRSRVAPDRSRIYGAELSLRAQARERWAGWFTYSWSEATDEFGPVSAPRSWNQLNSVNGGVSWTLQPWQLSANLTWHNGWRRSEIEAVPDPTVAGGTAIRLAARNGAAWDPFLSLDLRATWSTPVRWGALRFYGEVINATDNANGCCEAVSVLRAPGGAASLQRRESGWLPRYALVGVTWDLP